MLFAAECPDVTALANPVLERKIRLLTLASVAFENVGGDLSYAKVASALEVDSSDVERWVIDGMFPLFLLLRKLLNILH